ncbi:hypothetical protein [Allostreptomyces psammosilenae]|uniref:Uncharacterized protein n=1 Tax=Allostreptomyces psammosilenae TaxID=1892865 RepID=A0A852ZTP3_9ACTN|nr:hypothetical protein [Allostreptomyces psammosilenae]NYI05776.1 hypothetical protein [Allostreptomyces psammosilenae]
MEPEWEYRAVLAVDIERSAGRGNTALGRIREALGTALRESVERSGIDWRACLIDDLGDGLRLVAPAGVRKTALVHPLLHELAVRLRAHNRMAGPTTRIRVRGALHAGEVRLDRAGGATGRPLEVLARMLDAAPVRTALERAPEPVCVAVLLSQHFHDETVGHDYPGIDPEAFRRVTFTTKEHTADAWLHLPGAPLDPPEPAPGAPAPSGAASGTAPDAAGEAVAPPPAGHSAMYNQAWGNGTVNALRSGTQNIHLTRPEDRAR